MPTRFDMVALYPINVCKERAAECCGIQNNNMLNKLTPKNCAICYAVLLNYWRGCLAVYRGLASNLLQTELQTKQLVVSWNLSSRKEDLQRTFGWTRALTSFRTPFAAPASFQSMYLFNVLADIFVSFLSLSFKEVLFTRRNYLRRTVGC